MIIQRYGVMESLSIKNDVWFKCNNNQAMARDAIRLAGISIEDSNW